MRKVPFWLLPVSLITACAVALTAQQPINLFQANGTAIDTNSGSKSAGTLRVVVATDQPQLTNSLKVDGSAITQPISVATITDGTMVTWGTKTDNKSTSTDTTSVSAMSLFKEISAMVQATNASMTTATTANTAKPYISTGSSQDKFSVKASAGVLAGLSAFNSHASTDAYVKCYNIASGSVTVGSSAVFYRMLVPHASGAVDRSIEWTFDTALTCAIVTGKADSDATSVGANDIVINLGYR